MKSVWKWILFGLALFLLAFCVALPLFSRGLMLPVRMMSYRSGGMGFGMMGAGGLGLLGLLARVAVPILFLVLVVAVVVMLVRKPSTPPAPTTKPCPKCGQPVEQGWVACPHCGEKL